MCIQISWLDIAHLWEGGQSFLNGRHKTVTHLGCTKMEKNWQISFLDKTWSYGNTFL